MKAVIRRLQELSGTRFGRAFSGDFNDASPLFGSGTLLPQDHIELLRMANGIAAYYGYFRLFGVDCVDCINLTWWNENETWKFAWPQHVRRYLSFGETAWGDQFAYDTEALARGDATVFLLDGFEMEAEPIAESFAGFLTAEFLRQAENPYDSMTRAAKERVGPLEWNEHVTYIPSLLLGGDERIENVTKMNARASMIVNGDIATQRAAAPERSPSFVENYEDDFGRLRTRVVWRD
jgi:hypothetical protein